MQLKLTLIDNFPLLDIVDLTRGETVELHKSGPSTYDEIFQNNVKTEYILEIL